MYSWGVKEEPQNMSYSPSPTSFGRGSPEGDSGDADSEYEDPNMRRGRPRADIVNSLIFKGSLSGSSIRCEVCNRVFPREKSLQAHMRTHTGERPYGCDYPGCEKAFCQSGQLKTHQRLHTGEKPFMCSETGCLSRFTHANRHCSEHPYATLVRVDAEVSIRDLMALKEQETSSDVREWLEIQIMTRQDRSGHRGRSRKKRLFSDSTNSEESQQPENKMQQITNNHDYKPHPVKNNQQHYHQVTNENIQPINTDNIYQPQIKQEMKYEPLGMVNADYHPQISDYKMPVYYNDYQNYNGYNMQPVRSDYDMQYPLHEDYKIMKEDFENMQPLDMYGSIEPYNQDYTVTELQPVTSLEKNTEDIGEMTLSEQTDKWISALALVELSHGDL